MWRRAAPCITEPTTSVLWRGSMANPLVRSLATRPTWVWWLSRLPRWVAICTALMLRSGSYMQNPDHHHPLQAEEQEEEERCLLPGEGVRSDGGGRGRKEKKAALGPEVDSPPTWSSKRLSVPFRSIHSISGIQIIYTISQYMFVVAPRKGPTPCKEKTIHSFW